MRKSLFLKSGLALTLLLGALSVQAAETRTVTAADAQAMITKGTELKTAIEPRVTLALEAAPSVRSTERIAGSSPTGPLPKRDRMLADAMRKGNHFLERAEREMARSTDEKAFAHAYDSAVRAAKYFEKADALLAQEGGK